MLIMICDSVVLGMVLWYDGYSKGNFIVIVTT